MTRSTKHWEQFERLVAAIHRRLDPAAQVRWNDSINGRQFDVTIRFRRGLYDYLTVIECKEYSSPVPVEKVEAFITKSRDVNAHQAVIASSSGFQSSAESVARRHHVVLIQLTDSAEIDLSMFGAMWGPDIDALHIQAVALRYLDGDRRTLREAANAMTYYVNHLSVKAGAQTIGLKDLISQRVQILPKTAHDVYTECDIPLTEGAMLISPDDSEIPSKPIACITIRVALTKAKTYCGPRQFDPSLLAPGVDVQNISTGEALSVSRHGLPLGTAEHFEVGTFYEQPQLPNYYYCDQIAGDIATIYLVESFQLGSLFQAVFTVLTCHAGYYSPVVDPAIIERLRRRLAEIKST